MAVWSIERSLHERTLTLALWSLRLSVSVRSPRRNPLRPQRRLLLGWFSLFAGAACLDLAKLWGLAVVTYITQVIPIPQSEGMELALVTAFTVAATSALSAIHLLRIAWACFF